MSTFQRTITRWYYNIPINAKLNITNLVIIVIPMVLLALLSNSISSKIIFDKSVSSSVQELDIVRRSLDSFFNHVEYLSELTATNADVQNVISLRPNQLPLFLERRINVGGALEDITGEKNIIGGNSIMTVNDFIVNSGNIDPLKFARMKPTLTNAFDARTLKKGGVLYKATEPVDYFSNGKRVDSIAVYRYLLNYTGEVRGILRIDVDQRTVANLLPAASAELGEAFIVDEAGRVIISQNESRLYETIRNTDYYNCLLQEPNTADAFCTSNVQLLVTSLKYDRANWRIVRLIPTKYLTEDNNKVTFSILIAVLICLSLAVAASILNSRVISRPIIRLAKDMSHVGQGDMEVRFISAGNDEIGYLGRSFNSMLERMTELMDRVYLEQQRKREFELMALQAQINPHFLYNTLESVCALTLKNNNEDAINMVKSLAMFYRSILSKGRNVISIHEELENVRNYLTIQKIRYGDKFEYLITIDPQISDKSIVKLIIQPLVENAIYHGIRQKHGKGLIVILGKIEGNSIVISVADDGIGFPNADAVRAVLRPSPEDLNNHYGLYNVNERIKLYFGPDFGLQIFSEPGNGTRIDVTLPSQAYEH